MCRELRMPPVVNKPCELWKAAPLLDNMEEDLVSPHTPLSTSFAPVASYRSISPELSRNLKKAVMEGNLLEVVSMVREMVERVSRVPVSIAVTGDSGNGMSSFINALREIGHEERDSAPTGVVRTTLTAARYTSRRFPYVSLWDLPGMGASGQSLDNYLRELHSSPYDLFIVIASEQFSMNHVELAKTIQGQGKRFHVVWTKVDRDLSTTPLPEVLLKNIRESILESLRKEGVREPPVFLVSSLDPSLHDFPAFRKKLKTDISNIRCSGPLKVLFRICEETIQEKVTSLQARVSTEYLQNTPGIRDADNLEQLKIYRSCFGVDDESLQQVARRLGRAVSEYRNIVRAQDFHTVCRADWRLRLTTWFVALLRLLRWIPCFWHCAMRWFAPVRHRRVLHLLGQDTMTILKKILADATCPA